MGTPEQPYGDLSAEGLRAALPHLDEDIEALRHLYGALTRALGSLEVLRSQRDRLVRENARLRRALESPESSSWSALGRRVHAARVAAGLQQGEVADAAGVSRALVSRLEGGHAIGARCLFRIAAALGVDVAQHMTGVSDG